MGTNFKRATSSPFLRYNAIAFVGSIGVAALNYLYYPVIGRLLHPADFGEVQAITSIYLQAVVFMSVFNVVIISLVNKYPDSDTQNRLIAELEKVALVITFAVMVILFVSSAGIASFFKFGSVYPLLLLLLALSLSVPSTFRMAFLQGKRRFGPAAASGAISAAGKLLLGTVLVVAGWRAFGAILGIVVAQLLALVYLILNVRRRGWIRPTDYKRVRLPDLKLIRPELYFAVLVLGTTVCFNLFLSLDILAVKHWFAPTTAGLYGGIETLGRIVFYVNGSVAAVLLATVSNARSSADNRRTFYRSAILSITLGLAVMLVFLIAPRLVVTFLMGRKFLFFVNLLPLLGLFAFLASMINLVNMYYLAQRKWFIAIVSVLGLAATFIILAVSHATPRQIVIGLNSGALLTLVLIGAFGWLWPRVSQVLFDTSKSPK
jgi:O-antigen/teichoic acid export membrane protein